MTADLMTHAALEFDKDGKPFKRDYVTTVHVMRCLRGFVSKDDMFDILDSKRREMEGELKKAEPLKPVR